LNRIIHGKLIQDPLSKSKKEPQTGFDIEERKNNLKKALKIIDKKRVNAKNIVLIDDVLTT